jgi:putative copper export protein
MRRPGAAADQRRQAVVPWWAGEAPVVPPTRPRTVAPGGAGGRSRVTPMRLAPAPTPGPTAAAPVTTAGSLAPATASVHAFEATSPRGLGDTMQLARARPHRREGVHPRPPAPPPRRRMATVGRVLAAGVGTAGALTAAWFVLVMLRFEAPVARRSLAVARLDAAVAAGRSADHLLSVATWAGYVAATVVLGGLAFRAVATRSRGRLPLGAVAGAGAVAAVVSVPLRAAEVTGAGLPSATDHDVLVHVVTSTFGGAMALRAAGLLLVAASLDALPPGTPPGPGGRRGRWLTRGGQLAGAGLVVASYLVIGHAQATDPVVVEVIALAVHIAAAAAWFGGVAALAFDLRPGRAPGRRERLPASAVARFSRMAEVMVVLVIVSGAVLAEGQNLFAKAPWTTGYGQAFIAKLGFVAVVLAIGGYNRQRVVPAVAERDDAAARAHLRSTCVVEALVISMGVLLMTAAMTSGGF